MALRKRPKSRPGESPDSGFLASIVAAPDDDTRRLAYADWLDEHDHPERAEIIRVQCALARLRYDDSDASVLQAREHRLRVRHLPRWRKETGLSYVGLRRGFVEGFPSSHPHDFRARAETLFAAHPIRNLALVQGQDVEAGWGAEVAACSYLSRIETLYLPRDRSCGTDRSDFVAVLSSPHLTNLTTLDAGGGHDYGDEILRDLLGTGRGRKSGVPPSLQKLRRLSLSGMGLTDAGVRALARSPLAETLTGLDLSPWAGSMHITAAGITALVKSPLWPRLEELNLSWNAFADAEPVRILFKSLHRSRIRRLGLRNWDRSAHWSDLAEVIAGARSWGNLEALDLGSTGLSNEGLRSLLQSKHLTGLRWLAFDRGPDDKGLRELADCPHLAGLTALWLNGGKLTDRGMGYLAKSPYLTGLVYLNVDSTRARDKGVAEFVRSPNTAKLRFLELPGNLGDETYEALATSPYTNRLNVVTFGGYVSDGYKATLTDAGVLALTGSTNLPNLTCVNLVEQERLTHKGWESLLGCDRLASVHGHKTAFDGRFRERFPLSRAELAGNTRLRLFPWSYGTYP